MLSFIELKSIIESKPDPRIIAAREMSNKLVLHVDGVGLQDFLARINNYENEEQFKAREKHAISNKFITEELLRPTDNAFNARGGSKNYKFKTDSELKEIQFTNKLSEIRNSHSLSWYIENEWFNKFITDPNGLIVIESTEEGEEAYPTYKSIHSIKGYKQNGVFVDWVVFEPHEEIKTEKIGLSSEIIKRFWAVDEVNWYLVKQEAGKVIIENVIPHGFNRTPAMLCSSIVDNVTGWKKSPIDAQVELLNKYVVSHSVLNIAEFFHNYPQVYEYADDCVRCGGSGNLNETFPDKPYEKCPNCQNGRFVKKDVTDVTYMKVAKDKDTPMLTVPPKGVVDMPTEPWELMIKSVDRTWNRIFFSHWGTVVSREGKNETATGRYIDAQPVNNRLNKYSKSIEQAHTIIANFLGNFYFPLTFDKAFIQYGRRYLIETPDQIWEKYLKAKLEKAPVSTLDILLSQYLESEFRENEQMYIVETKKVKLEPFVHWDIALVRESLTISNKDKQRKEFFGEWVQTKSTEEMLSSGIESLRGDLNKYVKLKVINDESKVK